MTENKGYVTANDLQRWIDHLTDEEKELPIVASEVMFPKPSEMLELTSIGHYLTSSYDGFVIVIRKNYKEILEKELKNETENRFSVECDDADICEDNHFLAVAYDHHNAKKITERLNELTDKNKKLSEKINLITKILNEDIGYIESLKKIEEALK